MNNSKTIVAIAPVNTKVKGTIGQYEFVEEVFDLNLKDPWEEHYKTGNASPTSEHNFFIDHGIIDISIGHNGKVYLTVSEAAKVTGISKATLRKWCRRNCDEGFVKRNNKRWWLIEQSSLQKLANKKNPFSM